MPKGLGYPDGLSRVKPHMSSAPVESGTHWPTGFTSQPTMPMRKVQKTPTLNGKMMSEELKHY